MEEEERKYSTWGRPFRLQLPVSMAAGFEVPASRGRCQYPGCWRFEWDVRRNYCRDHWLAVYEQDRLPERDGLP